MKTIKQLILLLFIFVSCAPEKKTKFSLEGSVEGVKEGTYVYLLIFSTKEIIDSAKVENSVFKFETNLPFSPLRAIIKSKSNFLYQDLWLENNKMTFNSINQDYNDGIVVGSETDIKYRTLYKVVDTLSRKDRDNFLMKFVEVNKDNILGPCVLTEWYVSWEKEKTEALYQKFSDSNKNSQYGKEILKYIQSYKNPGIGDRYVDFELKDQFDKQVKLSDVEGKLILLDFWASWCGPCRKDNKNLVNYYQKFNSLGFEIVQVSLDDNKEDWINAINQDNLPWTNISDLNSWKSEGAMIYAINLLPSNYLINEQGIIIDRDIKSQDLEDRLKEILE
ncbi:AhpC/TSA family protein [Flavobacteriaceae bacterium XHP0103]|uniref:TlpA disulfide reductase family protein n=1 Tax=Marixanthotalea marina TaxID=2844359 RepID=UPI002989FFAC|nr:TlpA disulfide reductase family protein [Marixanthotalea marina]MBU3822859.1 AhpC/TSA family protein [Marixanthotalea marina]